jgi:hypothetical protein
MSDLWKEPTRSVEVRSENHLQAFCRVLLHRRAVDRIRKERSRRNDVHFSDATVSGKIERLPDHSAHVHIDAVAIVDDLLLRLSANDRRLLKARLIDKQHLHEIATRENTSVATIHRRITEVIFRLYHITNFPAKVELGAHEDCNSSNTSPTPNGQPNLVEWKLMIERLRTLDAEKTPLVPEARKAL